MRRSTYRNPANRNFYQLCGEIAEKHPDWDAVKVEAEATIRSLDTCTAKDENGRCVAEPGDLVRAKTSADSLIAPGTFGVIEGVEGQPRREYEVTFNMSPLRGGIKA